MRYNADTEFHQVMKFVEYCKISLSQWQMLSTSERSSGPGIPSFPLHFFTLRSLSLSFSCFPLPLLSPSPQISSPSNQVRDVQDYVKRITLCLIIFISNELQQHIHVCKCVCKCQLRSNTYSVSRQPENCKSEVIQHYHSN